MASEEEEGGSSGQEELDRLPCPGSRPWRARANAMSLTGSLRPVRLLMVPSRCDRRQAVIDAMADPTPKDAQKRCNHYMYGLVLPAALPVSRCIHFVQCSYNKHAKSGETVKKCAGFSRGF